MAVLAEDNPSGGHGSGDHEKDVGFSVAQPAPSSTSDEKPRHEGALACDSSSSSITVQSNPKRTWRSYLWDTFDKSPEERRFLFKLDAVILTFASLGYFIKYLDQVRTCSRAYHMYMLHRPTRLTSNPRSTSAMRTSAA